MWCRVLRWGYADGCGSCLLLSYVRLRCRLSAEILRLEAVRVAVVDELSLRPDDQVIASRGVGSWLAANTMLQVRDGKKIAALGAALRPFPAVAARFDCGDCSFEHAVLIVAFCESPPKGMPDEALPRCIDLLLAAASGVEATTTKVRNVIATLERLFESDEIPTPPKMWIATSSGSRRR